MLLHRICTHRHPVVCRQQWLPHASPVPDASGLRFLVVCWGCVVEANQETILWVQGRIYSKKAPQGSSLDFLLLSCGYNVIRTKPRSWQTTLSPVNSYTGHVPRFGFGNVTYPPLREHLLDLGSKPALLEHSVCWGWGDKFGRAKTESWILRLLERCPQKALRVCSSLRLPRLFGLGVDGLLAGLKKFCKMQKVISQRSRRTRSGSEQTWFMKTTRSYR